MSLDPSVLGIVGVGCIGGSIAARAKQLGVRVAAYDTPERLDEALGLGLIDVAVPAFDALGDCGLLVIAAPPHAALEYIGALVGRASSGGVVLDVGSVKVPAASAGAALEYFVPTHPIAGSERSGPAAASPLLFEGRAWAIVPQGAPEAQARVHAFVTAMGARPFAIDAVDHDRIVAATSHLPQLLSVALGAAVGPRLREPAALALSGSGLSSMLRLGASSWPMWHDVLADNHRAIAQEVRALAGILAEFSGALESGNIDLLRGAFDEAARAVHALEPAPAGTAAFTSDVAS